MKKYFSVLAAMALCSGSMLVSCTDDIQIGSLDESQYENVKELKGAVRDAMSGKTSTIVDLRRSDYSTSVEFRLARAPKKGVDVTITYDAEYLETYNKEHGTSFELYPADKIQLQHDGKLVMAPDDKASYSLDLVIPALDTVNYKADQTYLLPLKAEVKADGISISKSESHCVYLVRNLAGEGLAERKAGERETFFFFEVNDTNPLNALQWKMEDGRYLVNYLVLFAANINYDREKGEVYIYTNPQVTYILAHNEEIIQPLRKHGIKVILGLLGNHDESGLAQLSEIGARDFAQKIAAMCYAYNLDGVNFDDEYSNSPDLSNPLFTRASTVAGARLMFETKKAMPDKYVTTFQYGYMGGEDYVDGIEAGAWLDIAVANYGSKGYPKAGMTKANCSGQSTEMARYGAIAVSTAQDVANSEYGYYMVFAPWAANNQGSTTQFGYLSNLSQGLYGCRLVEPEIYYPSSKSLEYKPYKR